jgi:hypothetical protein
VQRYERGVWGMGGEWRVHGKSRIYGEFV